MPKSMVMRVELSMVSAVAIAAFQEALSAASRIVDDQPWNDDAKECVANLKRAYSGLSVKPREDVAVMPLLIVVQEFSKLEGKEFAKVRELSQKALRLHRKGMSQ